ncbi:unnamed protein product, partial [marine sediment metagenome]
YIHIYKLPLPVVQKQVGHRSLKSTSIYLNPSDELVAKAYSEARQDPGPEDKRIVRYIKGHSVIIPE